MFPGSAAHAAVAVDGALPRRRARAAAGARRRVLPGLADLLQRARRQRLPAARYVLLSFMKLNNLSFLASISQSGPGSVEN